MTSTAGKSNQSLDSIQVLRALAALGVVVTHVITRLSLYRPEDFKDSFFKLRDGHQWTAGDIGVDLFFVISGFIMMYVHQNDVGRPNRQAMFFWKRAARLVPLYWFFTTVALILFVLFPNLMANSKYEINVMWVFCSYFFIPTSLSADNVSPVVGVGWTLDYEIFFYLIFGLLLPLRKSLFAPTVIAILTGIVVIGNLTDTQQYYFKFASNCLLIDFVGGLAIASAASSGYLLGAQWKWFFLAMAVCLILWTFNYTIPESGLYRLAVWGAPSMVIVWAVWNRPLPNSLFIKCCKGIGNASYSVYLSQVFSIPFWSLLLSRSAILRSHFDLAVLIIVVMVLLSGVIVSFLIEKPMQSFMAQVIKRFDVLKIQA